MHSLYNVSFTAGETSATLMVSTMDDNTTELSEDFVVVINSTDQPGAVEIGPYDMALVTVEENDPGVCTIESFCAFIYCSISVA